MSIITREQLIKDLKASTQNSSGMFEIGEETICALMSLLTAPRAPVSLPVQHWEELCRQNPDMSIGDAIIRAAWWNHCAAMLQGAKNAESRCSNSTVIPDGWVACSERMPGIGTEIFYFCQDDGLRDCGIVSSSNFSDKSDAQLYVHAEGYDLRFGVDITHWMPLPAAPQQELKS